MNNTSMQHTTQLFRLIDMRDAQGLEDFMQSRPQLEGYTLSAGLDHAVNRADAACVKTLIDCGVKADKLDTWALKNVVDRGDTEIFGILKTAGVNFSSRGPQGYGQDAYRQSLRFLEKEYECAQLRTALAAARQEICELKSAQAPQDTPALSPATRQHAAPAAYR